MSFSRSTKLMILWLLLSGCQAEIPDPKVTIYGLVTWNGNPIEQGQVGFIDQQGRANSTSIAQGKFETKMLPGEYKLSFTAEKVYGEQPPDERSGTPQKLYYQYLPKECNQNSETKAKVEPGTTTPLTFVLKGIENPAPGK